MNRVYPIVFAISSFIVITPRISYSQCNCAPSVPATPITYYASFPATNAATTTVTFPQFNPAIGTLSCLSVSDTVTGVTTTSALNKASSAVTYKFQLTVSNDLEGPAGSDISISDAFNRIYGPTTLQRLGFPGDTVTYGPDTIFNNDIGFQSSTVTAPFLGNGTVGFSYSLGGGVINLLAGLNYTAGPTTDYWGNFSITYYWCPATILSTTIADFTATPSDGTVLLQWLATNQQPNTQYEIQISKDGKSYYPVGQAEGDASATGSSAKYQYQYHPDPTDLGKCYYRIEEKDPSGKISYSTVLILDPNGTDASFLSYQTFPNPATNSLQVAFNSNQTGHFLVELVATSGQVIQKKAVTLAGSSQIRLDLSPQPVKGLYFLRTTDLTHEHSYVSKVFID
jgi:hypothetical protein